MLMAAALHMDSAHGHGPSPWLPVLADDSHHRHHQIPRDFAASAPSPTPATAAPPNHHHPRPATAPRPSTRRVAKRRPRPSRKLPTTYITADPASFRRMVHQVTGADDLPMPPTTPEALICRPAPSRAGGATGPGAMMLPTLDTSAFLLSAPRVPARTDAPCAGSAAGSAAAPAPAMDRAEAGDACNYSGSSCGGFPTLDSWDGLF